MGEKRKEQRESVIDVIRIDKYLTTANVFNMSNRGICIETDANLEKGENYNIKPILNTSSLTRNLIAEVRWKKYINDSFSGKYRYGLMFSDLNFHSHNYRYLGLNSEFTIEEGNYN